MQFAQIKNRTFKHVIKRAFILSLIVMTALGALIADTVTKPRDFDGQIKLSICGSDGKGGWVVKDSIAANLRFGFTVADLAAIAGVSIRSLQQSFRRYVGIPPMTYLRDLRLARVHEHLREAEPTLHSVTDIAYRYGFTHMGRFAAEYRARYGLLPSETLRA